MSVIASLLDFWLRIASFFRDQKVAEMDSEVNNKLEIEWVNGHKVLNVDNANYSFGSLYKTFRKTFDEVKIRREQFEKVLILGNGAGGTARLLRKVYKFDGIIHGVEIDKNIIEVSKKYFPEGYAATNRVFNEDGYDFVMNSDKTSYDFVVFDIYKDLEIPGKFQTQAFITKLHSFMAEKSILVFNKVVRSRKTKREAEFLASIMKKLFHDFRVVGIGNFTENRMFVCRKW